MKTHLCITTLLIAFAAPVAWSEEGWSRFRGPNGSGVSTDTGLPTDWSGTKNIVWKTELPGPGASSPVIWGDHIFLTCYTGYGIGREPGEQSNLKRHLLCIDQKTGRILWNEEMKADGNEHPFKSFNRQHGYATHTPVIDETGVYVFFGTTGAAKYSHQGKLIWQEDCGKKNYSYGSGSSPILYGDHLVVNASAESSAILGLDRKTGAKVWQHDFPGAWPTPILRKGDESVELVIVPGTVLDAETGAELWSFQGRQKFASAVVAEDLVIFADGEGVRAVKPGDSPEILWENEPGAVTATPVYHEGLVYWITDLKGVVCCADVKTGEMRYKESLTPDAGEVWASPVLADGKIYIVTHKEGAFTLAAGPDFEILAHNTIEGNGEEKWIATPAIHEGRLYLRSSVALYCIGD